MECSALGFVEGAFLLLCAAGGACVASFLETAAHRSVQGRPWWGTSRSVCESCGAVLGPRDLIPLLSALASRGRCRHCGAPIPLRHGISEAVLALVWGLLAWHFGPLYPLIPALTLSALALFHALTDLECGYIYDLPVVVTLALGLALRLPGGVPALLDGVAGAAAGWGVLAAVILASRGGMGWGDALLMLGFGAFLGWKAALLALYGGFAVGGVWAVTLLLRGKAKRKDPIPLGPFLALGAVGALLLGNRVLDWFGFLPSWPWG